MSYEIIKRIQVRDGKVMIKSCSNNVRPRTPHEWECTPLTAILQEKGEQALDLAIMKDYVDGTFQGSKNKYTRALQVLRHMPEYARFNWRNEDYEAYQKEMAEHKEEFEQLMLSALRTRLPKEKYIIVKPRYDTTPVYYRSRKGARFCRWYEEQTKATLFSFMQDAINTIKNYTDNDNWYVVKLN